MPVGFQQASGVKAVGEPEAAPHTVVHIEFGGDGHGFAHREPHALGHPPCQFGPPHTVTAVPVLAPVEVRAEEGTQQIPVTHVDFDRVEARLLRLGGRSPEVVDDPCELLAGRGPDQSHRRSTEARRRRQRRCPVRQRVGNQAGMADLRACQRALGVHGVGELAKRPGAVGIEHERVAMHPPAWGDGAVGDGRHRRATPRDLGVEVDERVADLSARHDAFEGRRLDEAVLQRQRTQPRGRERLFRCHWHRNVPPRDEEVDECGYR